MPFTVTNSQDVLLTANAGFTDRPDELFNARMAHPTPGQYFNTAAFGYNAQNVANGTTTIDPQMSGTLGSERKNALYGPHYRHVDVSLFKTFTVYKESTLEFRAEAFNVTNTTNYATPNASLQVTPDTNAQGGVQQQQLLHPGQHLRADHRDQPQLQPASDPVRSQVPVLTLEPQLIGGNQESARPLCRALFLCSASDRPPLQSWRHEDPLRGHAHAERHRAPSPMGARAPRPPVVPLPFAGYESANPLLRKLLFRLTAGPGVDRFNADILRLAAAEKPDLFWADKLLWLRPQTLRRLRAMGIATVSYMIDNPFGPRRDPGWRLYMQCIPCFDLHVTQRDQNLADYRQRGARDVLKIQTAYEPTLHFPPPAHWSDADRTRAISFIGTPYDDRAAILTRLAREAGLDVRISGNPRQWRRALDPAAFTALFQQGASSTAPPTARRSGDPRSTSASSPTPTRTSSRTRASRSPAAAPSCSPSAPRAISHRFVEDEEAVFFSSFDELVAKIRRYLPDEAARRRIAAAGRARAERDGYHNDHQVARILDRITPHPARGAGTPVPHKRSLTSRTLHAALLT